MSPQLNFILSVDMTSSTSKSVLWLLPPPADEGERIDEIIRLGLSEQDSNSTERFETLWHLARSLRATISRLCRL